MKNINRPYRIFAFIMAIMMFATSVNLAIDMHYCQGQLKSVSFFGKAKNCHEIMAQSSCPHHQKMMVEKEGCSKDDKNCCESKSIQIESDNDQIHSVSKIVNNQELQQFVVVFVQVFFQNVSIEKTINLFTSYKSPQITRDTYVLFETFLL